MLLEIWIQVCINADLIQYIIDSSICIVLIDLTDFKLPKKFDYIWR